MRVSHARYIELQEDFHSPSTGLCVLTQGILATAVRRISWRRYYHLSPPQVPFLHRSRAQSRDPWGYVLIHITPALCFETARQLPASSFSGHGASLPYLSEPTDGLPNPIMACS
jgi:hypothetical protein